MRYLTVINIWQKVAIPTHGDVLPDATWWCIQCNVRGLCGWLQISVPLCTNRVDLLQICTSFLRSFNNKCEAHQFSGYPWVKPAWLFHIRWKKTLDGSHKSALATLASVAVWGHLLCKYWPRCRCGGQNGSWLS